MCIRVNSVGCTGMPKSVSLSIRVYGALSIWAHCAVYFGLHGDVSGCMVLRVMRCMVF